MAGRLFPDHRSLGRVDLPRRLLHTIQMEIAVVCAGFLVMYFHMRGEKKGSVPLWQNPGGCCSIFTRTLVSRRMALHCMAL